MTEAPQSTATPKLYRTSVVIYTDYDPSNVELEDLAREATSGDAYCTSQEIVPIHDTRSIEGVGEGFFEFFGIDAGEEEGGAAC